MSTSAEDRSPGQVLCSSLTSNQLTAVGQAAQVSRGWRRFSAAKFSWGMVCFGNATFSGGTVDFSDAADWSDPPNFSEINPPPTTVVKLPTADPGQSGWPQ
jgi:hypothetical protein